MEIPLFCIGPNWVCSGVTGSKIVRSSHILGWDYLGFGQFPSSPPFFSGQLLKYSKNYPAPFSEQYWWKTNNNPATARNGTQTITVIKYNQCGYSVLLKVQLLYLNVCVRRAVFKFSTSLTAELTSSSLHLVRLCLENKKNTSYTLRRNICPLCKLSYHSECKDTLKVFTHPTLQAIQCRLFLRVKLDNQQFINEPYSIHVNPITPQCTLEM